MSLPKRDGCVRNGTTQAAAGCRRRPELRRIVGQAAAQSAMTAAQCSWKRRRRSASETRSPDRAWAAKGPVAQRGPPGLLGCGGYGAVEAGHRFLLAVASAA